MSQATEYSVLQSLKIEVPNDISKQKDDHAEEESMEDDYEEGEASDTEDENEEVEVNVIVGSGTDKLSQDTRSGDSLYHKSSSQSVGNRPIKNFEREPPPFYKPPAMRERDRQTEHESEYLNKIFKAKHKYFKSKSMEHEDTSFDQGFEEGEVGECAMEDSKSYGDSLTKKEVQDLYKSLEITDDDFLRGGWRADAIHCRGFENLGSPEIFHYFREYGPHSIEWLTKTSCNLVWSKREDAMKALIGLSCPIKPSKQPQNTKSRPKKSVKGRGENYFFRLQYPAPKEKEKADATESTAKDQEKGSHSESSSSESSSSSSSSESDGDDDDGSSDSSSSSSSSSSSGSSSSGSGSSSSSSSNSDSSSDSSSDSEDESGANKVQSKSTEDTNVVGVDVTENNFSNNNNDSINLNNNNNNNNSNNNNNVNIVNNNNSFPSIPPQQKEVDEIKSTNFEDLEGCVSVEYVGVGIPPGRWRLGVPCPNTKAILMRFAHCKDKKFPGLEKPIEYFKDYVTKDTVVESFKRDERERERRDRSYRKERKPHRRLMERRFAIPPYAYNKPEEKYQQDWVEPPPLPETKKGYKDLDDPTVIKHPWGFLAQNWGKKETQDNIDYQELLRQHVTGQKRKRSRSDDESEDEDAMDFYKGGRSPYRSHKSKHRRTDEDRHDRYEEIKREFQGYLDDDDEDVVDWRSKIKLPLMRMYADAEEKKKERRQRSLKGMSNRLSQGRGMWKDIRRSAPSNDLRTKLLLKKKLMA